ncbi:hypothetical protein BDV23DRAFT_183499 [Aspergillus alliaceus]|uniref:Uncharacterized protein n=1 Tax=Petromyces alliaceus TaxID=209559 RepID=A0A5N7C976_PETAA|nr:uncharacterized protein BDW43DRAFT_307446 [Aspergillus alliaceus]KAB8237166.1 hypothetical protein BDW43DRAFT_307446 [Aspergillus alliaceus]KAE8390398.1 hypothetical protein BDV23DRAFT_183499 [Aspergillus alliaceus]
MDDKLTINADLWDYDLMLPDDEIAKGSCALDAHISASSKKFITGKYMVRGLEESRDEELKGDAEIQAVVQYSAHSSYIGN